MAIAIYTAKYSNPIEREEALSRYRSRNLNSLMNPLGHKKGHIYRISNNIKVRLMEIGSKDLSVILDAPQELFPSILQEIQSPPYLGRNLS